MRTFHRICIEDYSIVEGDDRLELKRGKEYTTSTEKDGCVTVFSTYWAYGVPVSIFAGAKLFTEGEAMTPTTGDKP